MVLTGLWDGIVDKDEDGLLRVELDPLADDIDKLACNKVQQGACGEREAERN